MGTQHGNLHPAGRAIYSVGLHRNHVLATANTGEIGKGFGKMQVNGPEDRLSKEGIPGSKHSMYGYILTYSRLERKNV